MEQPGFLSVAQVARMKKMTPEGVYKAIKAGRLPHVRIGHLYAVPAEPARLWKEKRGRPRKQRATEPPTT